MNWIISKEPNNIGSRSNQSWNDKTPPNGYVFCEESDIYGVYVEYRGFVNIEYEGDTVTAMTGNQEALDAYLAEHPDPVPGEEQIPDEEAVAIIKGEITDAEALDIISGGTENDEG